MLLDALALPPDTELRAELCIVGAGAAGLALACALEAHGVDVLLLEAGGRRFEPAAQEGLRGEVAPGSPHAPPHLYRRRTLGGASAIWGGRCVPLDPIDLEARPWVPGSGWPIGWDELAAHYPAAQAFCDAGPFAYTADATFGPGARPAIDGLDDADVAADGLERFSRPTHFGRACLSRLKASARLRVLVHAQALRLETEGGRVTALRAAGRPGQGLTVRAARYVLAAGGLEVPRLLLASGAGRRGGLGNQSDAVGRHYMCHVENTLGLLHLGAGAAPAGLDFAVAPGGTYVRRKLALSAAAQRREGLLNTAFRLHHPTIADPAHGVGVLSAMYLVKDAVLPEYRRKIAAIDLARRDALVRDRGFWLAHAGNVARDAWDVARFGQYWLRRRTLARRKLPFVVVRSPDGAYPLDVNAEQIPHPDNRVRLSGVPDAHGLPRLRVDWSLRGQDADSLARALGVLRDAFARTGAGRLAFDPGELAAGIAASTPVGGHHLGTARMAASPRDGVVDPDGRVWGTDNLYVAGGAVFPTCGHANPTLTIVALSLRLAGHLRRLRDRPLPVPAAAPGPAGGPGEAAAPGSAAPEPAEAERRQAALA